MSLAGEEFSSGDEESSMESSMGVSGGNVIHECSLDMIFPVTPTPSLGQMDEIYDRFTKKKLRKSESTEAHQVAGDDRASDYPKVGMGCNDKNFSLGFSISSPIVLIKADPRRSKNSENFN